jgi:arabinogalactan oligomer/maltooligosaccharide transport system substrate-binding protein
LLVAMIVIISACSSSGGGASTAASAAASTAASAAASVAAPSAAASTEASAAASTEASASAGASAAASNSGATLVIWADQKRAAAIQPLAQKWATDNGVTVKVESIASDIQTKFKTASQAGNPPDVVVWAHDVIGDFVQNGAIDPIEGLSDTSAFDPLAIKGMTFGGKLYGVPYSVENIALIRNTDLAPTAPATMEDLVKAGQQLVTDKKATQIMALQVGQKGDAYHIYPLFTSGGGSFFGLTSTGDPDPKTVTVDSAESIAAGQKLFEMGEKGTGALKRSIDDKTAIPAFTGAKTAFLVSGPWAIADIAKSGVKYDITAIPPFADGKPAAPFIGVNGFYVASKGANKTLAQEFVTSLVPTQDFQVALYQAEPRRPALTAAVDAVKADDPNIPKFAAAGKDGVILPAIPAMGQVWAPFGVAEAAIVGGADPATALKAAAVAIRAGIAALH